MLFISAAAMKNYHSGWLKTREMYSLMVLEARSPESESLGWNRGVSWAVALPDPLGENPFPASSVFWWLLAFFGLRLHPSGLEGSIFKSLLALSSHHLLLLSVWNLLFPLPYNDPCDCIQGPPGKCRIISPSQNPSFHSICETSDFPYKETFYRF